MNDTKPAGEPVDETVVHDPDAASAPGVAEPAAAVWTPDAPSDAPAETTWTHDGAAPATDTWTAEPATRVEEAETASSADEYVPGSYSTPLYDAVPVAETTVIPPVDTRVAEAETVVVAPVVAEPARQPIFVQAPEAPVARGNRAAAGAIGLLAAIAFAALYLGVALGLAALTGGVVGNAIVNGDTFVAALLAALASWTLWVPVAVFFLAFWLLGAVINRGRWGVWVVFGLLVGVAAYAGVIAGVLVQAPFWTLTASEGSALVQSQLLSANAVAAFVIGRELTVWFGAWVARRGRRVTELNAEAQREYERTLEAGPTLYAS